MPLVATPWHQFIYDLVSLSEAYAGYFLFKGAEEALASDVTSILASCATATGIDFPEDRYDALNVDYSTYDTDAQTVLSDCAAGAGGHTADDMAGRLFGLPKTFWFMIFLFADSILQEMIVTLAKCSKNAIDDTLVAICVEGLEAVVFMYFAGMTPLSIILFTIFGAIQSLIIFGQMFKCMGGDGPCPEVEDMAAQRKEARNDIVKQIVAMVGGAVAAGPSVAAQSLSIYAPFSAYYFTVPQVFILWFQSWMVSEKQAISDSEGEKSPVASVICLSYFLIVAPAWFLYTMAIAQGYIFSAESMVMALHVPDNQTGALLLVAGLPPLEVNASFVPPAIAVSYSNFSSEYVFDTSEGIGKSGSNFDYQFTDKTLTASWALCGTIIGIVSMILICTFLCCRDKFTSICSKKSKVHSEPTWDDDEPEPKMME